MLDKAENLGDDTNTLAYFDGASVTTKKKFYNIVDCLYSVYLFPSYLPPLPVDEALASNFVRIFLF
jgi:hypothetical protein